MNSSLQSINPVIPQSNIAKQAFTMVELLVVLAIIVVITTISIPTIDAMTSPKHALRKEGRKIMKLMTEARTAAMKHKVQVDLRIGSETREVRMVVTRAFQTSETDTNLYEKVVTFDEEYELAAFTADQIQTGDEEKADFQSLEVPAIGSDETTEQLALSFTHFGGCNGGGITLTKDEMQLHIVADILTGRPKLVNRIESMD